MARDNRKYVYLTIGVLRGSETHQALLRDAQENNCEKQLPTLASIRLGDYYRLQQQGMLHSLSSPAETQEALQRLSPDFTDDLALNANAADDAWPE